MATILNPGECSAAKYRGSIGGPRCRKPATRKTGFGELCEECFEKLQKAAEEPDTLLGMLVRHERKKREGNG